MDIEKIKELRDKVYELEGLLELLLQRDDKREVLSSLAKGKIEMISALSEGLDSEPEEETVLISENDDDIVTVTTDDPLSIREEPAYPTAKMESREDFSSTSNFEGREKPKFCVNDRFRFKRELFGNSDSEMEKALRLAAVMNDYDDAEDYFIGELGWDAENENVIDFMEVLRQYYQK